ncbi:MAG: hypothetical protein NTV94_09805, partial [Planctomycetota bacterium]|nr:hypothetical protein [Planctomycetota bacterium]
MMIPAILAACMLANPPSTVKKPVVDEYHGVKVTDEYRWLEDWNDPAVKAWSETQNTYARSQLDGLAKVAAIRDRVTQIMSAQSISFGSLHAAAGKLIAIKRQPPKQQPLLVILDSADAPKTERVLLDPNVLDPSGHTAIDWAVPSHDGSLVAISISSGGSESGDVHIYDIASGKPTGDVVPRVNGGTAGGSLAWASDGKGFFYSRYPRAGERDAADMDFYTQVYFHALGTPTKDDVYELGGPKPKAYFEVKPQEVSPLAYGRTSPFEFTRIAEIWLQSDPATGRVLCTVQHGDGGTFAHYIRDSKQIWRQLADYNDSIVQCAFGTDGKILLVSRHGAPRGKVLSLTLEGKALVEGAKAATELIPESSDTIVSEFNDDSSLVATSRAIFVTYQLGGPSEIRTFDHQGRPAAKPMQANVADASGVTELG